MFWLAIATAQAAAPSGAPPTLQLICHGMGSQTKLNEARLTTNNGADTSTFTNSYSEAVIDDVRIDISGDGGRIRIPPPMLPPVRGGKDGWFELHDVIATSDEITARATINPFNHVKLRLDRVTGGVSFTVLKGQYRGTCQPFTADTHRAF